VNDRELRKALRGVEIPGEHDARVRTWAVVAAAHAEREPVAWPRRHARALVLAAAVAVVVAAALSPPGRAVLDSIRDAVGRERVERAQPVLSRLPAPGRVLAAGPGGTWIVRADGSRRRLGDYREATWSPHGLYVAAARGRELYALDPQGAVRWSLAGDRRVAQPRWAPSGFRIAYRSGASLRVVAGDGTGDRPLAPRVDPVAVAWRPGTGHVLAYALDGTVRAVDADTGALLWSRRPLQPPWRLEWSLDGRRLLAVGRSSAEVLDERGRRLVRHELAGRATAATLAPGGRSFAVAEALRGTPRSEVFVFSTDRQAAAQLRRFTGTGRFTGLAWSPDGRWILVAWHDADQWVFVRSRGRARIEAADDVTRQLGGAFPAVAGWCCPG
jgi:hypothetical protein